MVDFPREVIFTEIITHDDVLMRECLMECGHSFWIDPHKDIPSVHPCGNCRQIELVKQGLRLK